MCELKGKILFFILFLSITGSAEVRQKNESQVILSNGFEMHIQGNFSRPDAEMGLVPYPNSQSHLEKHKNGKKIFEWTATIDKDGFRTSNQSKKMGKTKHLILIDGSAVFGENLNDDMTLSHKINQRSKIYEAYPLAFLGYGPNHAWLQFSKGNLPKKIFPSKGSAIIFTHSSDIRRFLGRSEHLSYNANHPYIEEFETGKFRHTGSFEKTGTLVQRLISNFCVPIIACNQFLRRKMYQPTEAEYGSMGRLLKSIVSMYKEQFDVESFKIVWLDSEPEKLIRNTKIEVIIAPEISRSADGHPSAQGVDQLVDFLFSSKLVE